MPQVTITEVRNAQSLNAENTSFDVEINHPEYSWIPYTVDITDTDTTIDNNSIMSLVGASYGAYIAPTAEEITAELAASVRGQRDGLLASDVDPIAGNALRWAELTDAQRTAWGNYRTELLDLPTQEGFPTTVIWPTRPE